MTRSLAAYILTTALSDRPSRGLIIGQKLVKEEGGKYNSSVSPWLMDCALKRWEQAKKELEKGFVLSGLDATTIQDIFRNRFMFVVNDTYDVEFKHYSEEEAIQVQIDYFLTMKNEMDKIYLNPLDYEGRPWEKEEGLSLATVQTISNSAARAITAKEVAITKLLNYTDKDGKEMPLISIYGNGLYHFTSVADANNVADALNEHYYAAFLCRDDMRFICPIKGKYKGIPYTDPAAITHNLHSK